MRLRERQLNPMRISLCETACLDGPPRIQRECLENVDDNENEEMENRQDDDEKQTKRRSIWLWGWLEAAGDVSNNP
jgi:hypothetical protein